MRAIEAETFSSYGGLRQIELPKPLVVGQNSIQRLIDRRVARSAPPMMDLLGRSLGAATAAVSAEIHRASTGSRFQPLRM